MKSDYKQEIQNDIQNAGDDKEKNRIESISHRPQDSACHIVDQKTRDSGEVDRKIGDSVREYIVRGSHQTQHRLHSGDSDHRKCSAEDKCHRHGRLHRRVQFFIFLCAKILADHHSRADGEAIEEKHLDIHNHCGGTHCGKSLSAHIVPDHDHVHRVVQHLKNIADHQRQCKQQYLPDDRPLCHITGAVSLFHEVSLFQSVFPSSQISRLFKSAIGSHF